MQRFYRSFQGLSDFSGVGVFACIYNAYLRGDSFAKANTKLHKKMVLEKL